MANVSDYIVQRIQEWGVDLVFGYPGDGINGVVGAIDRSDGAVRFVQVAHEELGSFGACAYAKYHDDPDAVGVCLSTGGPGAAHLMVGLYDAKADHQPVVAIVGQVARRSIGGSYHQELDLLTMFAGVADYVVEVSTPAQVRQSVDRAFRTALADRTVAVVILPSDVQEADAVPTPERSRGAIYTGTSYQRSAPLPSDEQLDAAAEILNTGRKVALLVGAGALGEGDAVLEVADRLGAGVVKALLGKAVVSDDHPNVTGHLGLLGTRASFELMQGCDTLFMIGTSFPYADWLPPDGAVRTVQVDIDAAQIGLHYPADVGLVGDTGRTLAALLPRLQRTDDRSFVDEVATWRRRDDAIHEQRALSDHTPITPQRPFWMRAMAGNPRFEGSQALPEFPFADYAELLGLVGVRVEEPDAVGAAWDTVLAADRPAVLEVMCDPNVPTVPGHLTIGEATNYIEALAKGDPDAAQVVLQSARELWESASGTMKAAISERLG
jgi:pyruvate dehydrogenase (quinone)